MGLFDFIGDWFAGTADMFGMTRHARDQRIEMANQEYLMKLENQYHQENFDREFAAENAEFDRRYNEYQSPQAMVHQYNQAGLNASALYQKGNGGFSVSPAMQPSSPSPAAVVAPAKSAPTPTNSVDLLNDISRMELNNAQRDEIFALLKGKMREQDDAHELAEIMKAQQSFTLQLDKIYGNDERANKLANLIQEGLTLYLQGKESEKNVKFLEARTILADDEHVLNRQQLPLAKLYLEALIKATKAKASADYSQANYYRALSETEDACREFNLEVLRNEASLSSETLSSRVDEIISKAKAAKILPEQVQVELEKAKKENNLYYVREIVSMVAEGVGVAGQFYAAGKIGKAMNVRNEIQQKFNDWMQENNVTEKMTDTYNSKGKRTGTIHTYGRRRPQKGR